MSRLLVDVALLTLVYVLVLGSLDPWDLALGAAVATGLVLLFRRLILGAHPGATPVPFRRVLAFVPYVLATLWEITVGALTVLGVALRLRPLVEPGLVEIPLEATTRAGVVVAAFTVTVAPGTYLLDVDPARKIMLIHALDASDPEALRAHYHRLYERYQRHVFA